MFIIPNSRRKSKSGSRSAGTIRAENEKTTQKTVPFSTKQHSIKINHAQICKSLKTCYDKKENEKDESMNANGIRTQKQLQADRFLRNKVMLLHEGEALPSIRKLMEQSGLKRVVLEKSLQDFCRNRLLRAEPRRSCTHRASRRMLQHHR